MSQPGRSTVRTTLSRDNPVTEGCHVIIPPPRGTTRVLANAQGTAKLATHQERLSSGVRAAALGSLVKVGHDTPCCVKMAASNSVY